MRFPEFQGEWREKCLGEIAPLQRGFDLPTQNIKKGNIPIVYSNGILNYHNESKCKAPGLVTGRSGTIGKFTFIKSEEYWPHNTTLWATTFYDNYPCFIYYLYQSINIEQFATGSGVPTLNRNDVHKKSSCIPSIAEQKKIAQFLTLIDESISTQSKIIEKYESLIKTMVDNIFFQKIRFSNENNKPFSSWNRFYLKEIGEISSNGVDKTINSSEKKINLLNYMDIYNAINVTPENVEKLMQVTASATQIEEKNVSKGDFFFTPSSETRDDICKCNEILYDLSDTVYSYHIVRFRPKTNYFSLGFGKFCFNSTLFRKQMITACQGVQRFALSIPAFENAYVELPSIQEQEKISGFLMGIEKKILVEKEILLNYRQQKSYFMRQMFI